MRAMLVMDCQGLCRVSKTRVEPIGDVVTHDINGTALRMTARRVQRVEELDDPSLLKVPLPNPFGRHIVAAPVTWESDRPPLTIEKLDALLGSLIRSRRHEQLQSVMLQSYSADLDETEENSTVSESEDDESSANDDEECGEEDDIEEEGEEEDEEEEDPGLL